jgi:hypothetical protein
LKPENVAFDWLSRTDIFQTSCASERREHAAILLSSVRSRSGFYQMTLAATSAILPLHIP